jgi:hypothetical protein
MDGEEELERMMFAEEEGFFQKVVYGLDQT